MVIVVLIGAILFYAALYLLWELSHSRLNTVENWLSAFNHMVVMPDNVVFVILRGLILVTLLYVICDLLVSTARRTKRKKEARRDAANARIRWKRPPVG